MLIESISGRLKKENVAAERIKHLPEFSLTDINSNSFTTAEIKEGPLLIVYFHPECEHCQYEISELFRSSLLESDIKLMLVSNAPRDSIGCFLENYSLKKTTGIWTLVDTAFVFNDIFGMQVVPSVFLYNRNLDLINAFYGECKIETILNRFKSSEQNQ
jgi:thiol-disulfide isomerase/thioredoxin